MRDRGHVADRGDLEADRLERAQRRFAARAGALDLDLERAQAAAATLPGCIGLAANVADEAAVAAAARVQRALEILGPDVPDHLLSAGELRVQHRQASLEELGQLADPPMTKDAVAGRIRRLLSMADRRAAELGLPDTESVVTEDMLDDA